MIHTNLCASFCFFVLILCVFVRGENGDQMTQPVIDAKEKTKTFLLLSPQKELVQGPQILQPILKMRGKKTNQYRKKKPHVDMDNIRMKDCEFAIKHILVSNGIKHSFHYTYSHSICLCIEHLTACFRCEELFEKNQIIMTTVVAEVMKTLNLYGVRFSYHGTTSGATIFHIEHISETKRFARIFTSYQKDLEKQSIVKKEDVSQSLPILVHSHSGYYRENGLYVGKD